MSVFGTLTHFRSWLDTRHPNESYDYADCSECIVTKYTKSYHPEASSSLTTGSVLMEDGELHHKLIDERCFEAALRGCPGGGLEGSQGQVRDLMQIVDRMIKRERRA